jgi:outer membrane protein
MSCKSHTIQRLIPVLLLLVLNSPIIGWASEVIDLEQALAIARKQNPSLTASQSDVAAAQARLTQSRAAYYPQLDASAGMDRTWNEYGDNLSANRLDNITDNYSTGLSVTQYLFDFGKTPAQVEQSSRNLGSTEMDYETAHKTLVRDVKQAYFEVLKNQQLVIVGKENLEVRQQQLAQAQALYRQGLRPKIDVTRGEVEVSQDRLNLVILEYGLQEAIIAFEKLLGGPPVIGSYSLAEENPSSQTTPDLQVLIGTAMEKRSAIAGLEAQVKAAEAGLLSSKRSAYPSLTAAGTYTYGGDGLPMEDHRWKAGIYLNWPLFTGFRQTGQVNESRAAVSRLNALVESRKLSVTEEVTRAYFLLQTARETIKNAEIALGQAKDNLAIAQGRYKAGVSDSIELSDAQVLYTESRSALVRAAYESHKALAQLEFAAGVQLSNK